MRALVAVLSFACVLVLAPSAVAQPGAAPEAKEASRSVAAPVRMLSKEEAGADVALMRRALEGIHPGLYRRTPKPILDRAFADLETAVAAPISDVALYRRLSLVLAMIRCTHTKADQTEVMEAWRRDNPSHAPFRFRIVQGRMLVVSSDPAQTPLPRGAEILSINGRRTKDVIAALNPYVAIDGFTELSRAAFMADDSDLMGSDFDHFYPYVFGFPESFSLRVKDSAHSRPRTVRLSPVSFRAWVRLESGQAYRQDFADSTSWRMLSGEVGYLRIDTFVNYRKPVDAAALYARALNELRGAGARKLVVDLRENGGGSNDAALGLIDALASAPYTYQRAMRYRAVRYGEFPKYISSWGDRETLFNPAMERFTASNDGWFDLRPEFAPDVLKPRQPMSEAFKGPVTVLIGPANASGATMTAAKLRDMGRVRLVGEPSGGSADGPTAGTIFNVKLPNSGISVRVPLVFNAMEVSRFDKQGGITPDVHVPLTVADFRAGRDRALERALADLEKTSAAP